MMNKWCMNRFIESHVFSMFNVTMGTEAIASVAGCLVRMQYRMQYGAPARKIDQLKCKKIDQSEFVIFPINSEIRVK